MGFPLGYLSLAFVGTGKKSFTTDFTDYPEGSRVLSLHHYSPRHLWVHPAEVGVLSWIAEAELEFIAGVERGGFELALSTVDGVRYIVSVGPDDLRTRLEHDCPRGEGEIVDLHIEGEPRSDCTTHGSFLRG